MLSHVEMAPAAGGFKLFGKVITQCAAPAPQEAAASRAVYARERAEPDEQDQPVVKREAPAALADHDFEKHQHHVGGAEAPAESGESKGQPRGAAVRQQETAEARAAAAASSAPPLPCPRCRSRNTKFCYFNNYNVNQPRHFCKDCHRYWTAGGALRNVPIGAGRRKNRPLGPVVAGAVPAHHQHHHRVAGAAAGVGIGAAAAAGFVLGFPGSNNPSSPTSPVYADRWPPLTPDRRF